MKTALLMDFSVDKENNKINVKREFAAPVPLVWSAWTEAEILDQWWAPKPYKAKTKSMDFREGGHWLYAMVGPQGDEHWCRSDYKKVRTLKGFESLDAFCNEEGSINTDFPRTHWQTDFIGSEETTTVYVELAYASLSDLEKIIELGFKEGFTAALENLDDYIKQQFHLRSELKKDNAPRVTTYLNFPGNTEEAFNFYRSIFRTEFNGKGIQRFGDIPPEAGHPPVADSIKDMVLHVELPILGGHVLMATDAPQEMGFTVDQGNNMHICLEPETREETQRLFEALSEGGKVSMPLQDMFFGSFFGTCTDKYGINWMFSHQNQKN